MSNSGKVWDTREAYKQIRNNTWSRGAGRGFACGGGTPTNVNTVDVITLSTTGNAADYGDLATIQGGAPGYGSTTRGIIHAGEGAPGYINNITYINFSSQGNGSDFGDSTQSGGFGAGHSNNTRGIVGSFYTPMVSSPHISNVMEFITMASIGNATDFGDLGETVMGLAGYGNNTKWFKSGGSSNGSWTGYSNRIDTVTIATTGNSSDYADLNTGVNRAAGFSSTTRGITAGGYVSPGAYTALVQQNDLSSGATGTDFGDLTVARSAAGGVDNSVRGSVMGGYDGSSVTNHIDFMQIATSSNATDFGDLTVARIYIAGVDDSNAGLDFSQTQRQSVTYMPGSGRILSNGGNAPHGGTIEYTNISTLGNGIDFGDSAGGTTRAYCAATSNMTRAMFMGGDTPSKTNLVDAVEIASRGNSFDFGNLTAVAGTSQGCASTTRAINAGGVDSSYSNIIEYAAFATAGNFTDFGDLTAATGGPAGASSPTRGLFMGGYTPSASNKIDYITIASTGNATDFGDLTTTIVYAAGGASSTRALRMGGATVNVIDYVTTASTGNATDFGDLTVARGSLGGGSSNTRALALGGAAPSESNVMDYVTIASTGNAADFGDMYVTRGYFSSASDSHGGLQS